MADFIKKTNEDYAAWCATKYTAEFNAQGLNLHGLWAWQEQERRKAIAASTAEDFKNLLNAAVFVCDTFKKDLAAGYVTRDKQFAVEVLGEAIASYRATLESGKMVASFTPSQKDGNA